MRSSLRQKQVKELVTRFPSLVENYSSNILVVTFWKHIEGARTIDDAANCSSPEAITRAFRRLVESGEIVLSDSEKERNAQHQESFREDYQPI